MSYFGKSLVSRKIAIHEHSANSDNPEMLKRLERIEINYAKLAGILTDLEAQFEMDDRLAAIFDGAEDDSSPRKPR